MKETIGKISVTVYTETSYYVMGRSKLLLLEDYLTPKQKNVVEIEWASCLELCTMEK
jgi:hypothetical protein